MQKEKEEKSVQKKQMQKYRSPKAKPAWVACAYASDGPDDGCDFSVFLLFQDEQFLPPYS
jgi:hypothetical protein